MTSFQKKIGLSLLFLVLVVGGCSTTTSFSMLKWLTSLWSGGLDALVGITSVISASCAWWATTWTRKEASAREKMENEKISIILTAGLREVTLPYQPRRRDLSRAELLGLIGSFYGADRFNLPGVAEMLVSGKLGNVLSGVSQEIRIEVKEEDLVKFESFIQKLLSPTKS